MWPTSVIQGYVALLAISGLAAAAPGGTTTAPAAPGAGAAARRFAASRREEASSTAIKVSAPPGGRKAGCAGTTALKFWNVHLGWYHNWEPDPSPVEGAPGATVTPVAMLWGGGTHDEQDASRLAKFLDMTEGGKDGSRLPSKFVLGFNEPDCDGEGSAGMTVREGAGVWNELLMPLPGDVQLGSPAMCKQLDQTWLSEFAQGAADLAPHMWTFVQVHVFKPTVAEARAVVDYYWGTFGLPVWVTEFACVHDADGFTPCSADRGDDVPGFIRDIVDMFEAHEGVLAYAYTDAPGNGDEWVPTAQGGTSLSPAGKAYLDAITKYYP